MNAIENSATFYRMSEFRLDRTKFSAGTKKERIYPIVIGPCDCVRIKGLKPLEVINSDLGASGMTIN